MDKELDRTEEADREREGLRKSKREKKAWKEEEIVLKRNEEKVPNRRKFRIWWIVWQSNRS